jgi:hypothetical protein
MRIVLAVLLAPIFAGAATQTASAQPAPSGAAQLPAIVAQARAEIRRDCGSGSRLKPGFQRAVDFNGDGKPDYFLDFSAIDCPSAPSFYCGSAGCTLVVVMSDGEGYREVFNSNVRGWSIARSGDHQVLVLDLHGSACNRSGADACRRRLTWNGRALTPGGSARR